MENNVVEDDSNRNVETSDSSSYRYNGQTDEVYGDLPEHWNDSMTDLNDFSAEESPFGQTGGDPRKERDNALHESIRLQESIRVGELQHRPNFSQYSDDPLRNTAKEAFSSSSSSTDSKGEYRYDHAIGGMVYNAHSSPYSKRRRVKFTSTGGWMALGFILAVTAVILVRNEAQRQKRKEQQQIEMMRGININATRQKLFPISGRIPLWDASSPQHKALEWVSANYGPQMEDASVEETYVITLLYFSTNGKEWRRQANFLNPSVSICGWNFGHIGHAGGIYCDHGTNSVHQISLHRFNLQGTIPAELSYLSNLEFFYAGTNGLQGSIPDEIGSPRSKMVRFEVNNNELRGTIPAAFHQLRDLETFNAKHNHLTGTIPSELGELSLLQHLVLHVNSLEGSVPSELGRILPLRNLTLAVNRFTGTFPTEIVHLTRLRKVKLDRNNITGDLDSIFCANTLIKNNSNATEYSSTIRKGFRDLLFVEADSCMGRNHSQPKVLCGCCCCNLAGCGGDKY